MKLLHITLFLCFMFEAQAQAPSIHILGFDCVQADGLPNPASVSLSPNRATIRFEALWNDGNPKTVFVTPDGDLQHRSSRALTTPGVDTLTVEFFPTIQSAFQTVGIYLELFSGGTKIADTGDDFPTFSVIYGPAENLEIEDFENQENGFIEASVLASDWNVHPNEFYTCRSSYTAVRTRILSCEDGSVIDSKIEEASDTTPDTYSFSLNPGTAGCVKLESSIIHVEKNLAGFDSLVGTVKTVATDCFHAETATLVGENKSSSFTQAYPNPFSETCHISPPGIDAEMFLYDATGQLVRSGKVNSAGTIEGKSLAPGYYLLVLKQGELIRKEKLLRN